jgi:hypothetical protein
MAPQVRTSRSLVGFGTHTWPSIGLRGHSNQSDIGRSFLTSRFHPGGLGAEPGAEEAKSIYAFLTLARRLLITARAAGVAGCR